MHKSYPFTVAAALVCLTRPVCAQQWAEGSTPELAELVQIDTTGESGWPYGSEDVADDGLDDYTLPEQLIDLRTVYATTSADELWVRVYVVGRQAPPDTLTLLVFVDADQNASTGGSAAAAALDDRLTDDPTDGGYEYVVVVPADGSPAELRAWTPNASDFEEVTLDPALPDVEVGIDTDPIRQGGVERGYVQVRVALGEIDLDTACDARLFVRGLSDDPDLGPGDLALGEEWAECRPSDANSDAIPDVAMPAECSSDGQCPGDLICIEGGCVVPPEPTSCDADRDCSTGFECAGGDCVRSQTAAGSPQGAAGNPNAITLPEGHEVQGGACNCSVPRRGAATDGALVLLMAGLVWRRRQRRHAGN